MPNSTYKSFHWKQMHNQEFNLNIIHVQIFYTNTMVLTSNVIFVNTFCLSVFVITQYRSQCQNQIPIFGVRLHYQIVLDIETK